MERVTGIGAIFIRAQDPEALMSWYAGHLGLTNEGPELAVLQRGLGSTVQAFPQDTDYFGSAQAWMLNFRVQDLDAMLANSAEPGPSWTTASRTTATAASAGRPIPKGTDSNSGSLASRPAAGESPTGSASVGRGWPTQRRCCT